MRRIWAVLALIAALTLPSVVAAVVLPTAEMAHAAKDCQPLAPGQPSVCNQGGGLGSAPKK